MRKVRIWNTHRMEQSRPRQIHLVRHKTHVALAPVNVSLMAIAQPAATESMNEWGYNRVMLFTGSPFNAQGTEL